MSIAYRMLGSMADAEDLVQETLIRWQASTEADVRSPRAYLVTILSRLCIHQMESARVHREQYVGPWLPEPVLTDDTIDPLAASEMQESLPLAFLLLLEQLTPVERAAFLLHDVFDYAYHEIAPVLNKSEANCRQIVHRGRQHILENRPRSVLSDEVVLYADGGGNANAALRPVRGALPVARFLPGAIGRSVPRDVGVEVEHVNGQPGLVYRSAQGMPGCVLAFEIGSECIGTIFVVTNPDKLTHLSKRA